MQPVELLACVYAIRRANKLFGVNVPIPYDAIHHPTLNIIGKDIHSRVTAQPLRINGETTTYVDGKIKRAGTGDIWGICTDETQTGRIHGFIHHAFDGVNVNGCVVPALKITVETAIDAMAPHMATALIIELLTDQQAQAHTITELRGRIALLTENKQ